MRAAVALLFAAALVPAAPVPKDFKPPPVELTLSPAKSYIIGAVTVVVTVRNDGRDELNVTHTGIPSEPFAVEIRDEKGRVVEYDIPESNSETLGVSTERIPSGKSGNVYLALHTGYFPNRVWPAGKLPVVIRLTHGEKVYTSKPLVLGE